MLVRCDRIESLDTMDERSNVLKVVSGAWMEILEVGGAETDANFFECGGDSILAVEFAFLIEELLGLELPMSIMFDARNLGEIVDLIVRLRQGEGGLNES